MRKTKSIDLLDAVTTTGQSDVINVSDYQHITLAFAGTNFTAKIAGSTWRDAPTAGTAASASNIWDYKQSINMQSGSAINGDTGVVVTTAAVEEVELNTNNLEWLFIDVTAITGACTVKGTAAYNQ